MKALIERIDENSVQTIGRLFVLDEEGFSIEDFPCLELPWKNNDFQVSCIPVGKYKVKKRRSSKYDRHFHVQDVEDRTFILIHFGNFYSNTLGCILPGMDLADINSDGHVDVTDSKAAMRKLWKLLPEQFELEIINGYAIKH